MKQLLRAALPAAMRSHRIWSGPLRGCQLVTSWRDYPAAIIGYTERPLLRWLAANVRRGETWLDVGAHYGYTAVAMSRLVGGDGRVFAFEPVPETAGCLAVTRCRNQLAHLTVLPIGLSDAPGVSVLDVPVVRGMAEHARPPDGARVAIVTMPLDGIWDAVSRGCRAVHGVKVDVQGMENQVLAGMRGLLHEFRPRVVVEFHTGVDPRPTFEVLDGLGYGLPGVALGGHGPDVSLAFVAGPPESVRARAAT
jgi:FkbM family methyltransferase